MSITIILIVSILLQFTAAFWALRLIWVTGKRMAWALIAAAILLMAIRRCITLFQTDFSRLLYTTSLSAELVALFISVLMLVGVIRIAPLFLSLKRSEKELRESREEYRGLFENVPISLWEEDFSNVKAYIDDLRGRGIKNFKDYFENNPGDVARCVEMVKIIDVNQATLDLYQAENKPELMRGLSQVFREETYDVFREQLTALAEGHTRFESERLTRTLKGDDRHVYLSLSVAPGYEASWSRVLLSISNITQRKQAEEALRKAYDGLEMRVQERTLSLRETNQRLEQEIAERKRAEEALRQQAQLLHLSYDAILVWRKDGGIEHWNKGAEQLYGYTESEVLGRVTHKLLKTIHPVPWQEIEAAMRKHGQWEGELRHYAKDGHEVTVSARHQLVLGTDGIERIFETNRDITERKKAEEAFKESEQSLRDSEQRLHLAQEAANAGAWEWDLRTNKNYWSEEIWELYGLEPHSLDPSYEAWAQTIHPDDRPNVEKAVQEAAKNGARLSIEWRVAGHAGNERWLMSIGQPVLGANGEVARYIGIAIDITERKRAEQIKDEFIGMVSHELRTPLTIVTGAIHTAMLEGLPPEELHSLLHEAALGAESLADILDNLLELSRYQAKRLQLTIEPAYLRQIVNDVVERFKSKSSIHRLIVEFPEQLVSVKVDKVRMERILHNLVENAIKYSPKGGEVRIHARREDRSLIVGVSDQGIGISLEDQARLFQPFQRLENQAGYGIKGLGLGLSVCSRLVEAHHGQIWVESKPGEGSTFYFSLPLDSQKIEGS
jgi:PAS domain S-box-containing protein